MRNNTKKNNAYRGVLKNKNLSKILESGFNAPVGSTKRKHAQKVFSILNKMQNDGKGGPGPAMPKVDVQLRPSAIDYSRMVVLPATPKVRVPIGKKAPASFPEYDGKGFTPFGAGATTPSTAMTLNLGGQTASRAGSLVIPKYTPSITSRLLASPLSKAIGGGMSGPLAGATMFGIPAAQDMYYASQDRILETPGDPNYTTSQSTVPQRQVLPKGTTATGIREAEAASAEQPVYWGLPGSQPSQPSPVELNKTGVPGQEAAAPEGGKVINPFNGMDLTSLSAAMAGGQQTESKPGVVQGAVDANMGASMFAYQAMQQGADYLKNLPGMEGVPDSVLQGGTLAERLKKTDEALRSSYGLDSLLNNYADLVKGGANLQGQMTDYVRGRDEFLNETEGLISDLKHASMKSDMSDPRTQTNMQNHMNYLYEMRGRQNKRYVEFLQMSTDEYTSRVTAAENIYTMRFDEYSRELEYNQNITTEQYNTLYAGIQEMYTTVANAPLMQAQLDQAEAAQLSAWLSIGSDASGISGSDNASELTKRLKGMDYIDGDGKWVINSNSFYTGQNAKDYLPVMQDAVQRAVMLPDKDGNMPSSQQVKSTIGNALGHLNVMLAGGYIDENQYATAQDVITSYAYNSLNTNNMIPADTADSYAEALSSLKPQSPWYWFNSETPDKAAFVSKWGEKGLNEQILTFLYDQMTADTSSSGLSVGDWADTYMTSRGDLGQGSTALTPDELRTQILRDYTNSFQAEQIAGDSGMDQIVANLSDAIKTVESGGNYSAQGASGEFGAYQFMPDTWSQWAQEFLGDANAEMSPENQDKVTQSKIIQLLNQGYTPEEVALIWNGGSTEIKSGTNSQGVAYDTGAYADKVMRQLYG